MTKAEFIEFLAGRRERSLESLRPMLSTAQLEAARQTARDALRRFEANPDFDAAFDAGTVVWDSDTARYV